MSDFFPFELSEWQKRANSSTERGGHCLVTAPTGSGKTVPAEFAIYYFTGQGKKVIYTSPIKALSNQKYYEFQKKFPNVSFGILTGDIKDNPEADVLIMTTEILCNHLHNLKYPDSKLEFNIDIQNELACVVFDEVHYINDADRGTVWEECFMLLPEHVQLVMLSATIATPEKFANWIESIHPNNGKKVELCDSSVRAVPLRHYMWLTAIDSAFHAKDTKIVNLMHECCNQLIPLYSKTDGFAERAYYNVCDVHYHLQSKHHIKRQHVLNQVVGHLKKNDMLPAICFVYSRKNVERFAKELTHQLNDSIKMNTVDKECRGILSRFPNAKEYLALPEYRTIVGLLEHGIGIHHSGLLPVFREMIELLFDKGYVQMLFATETFAVGLNMPTKTVLFTSLKKYDGREHRYLLPHEYTQQAGRAGRRGYDTIGHVIHLSNLFEMPSYNDYKVMMGNVPQTIVSKLKISYSMVLNYDDPAAFINKSAVKCDIEKEVAYLKTQVVDKEASLLRQKEHIDSGLRTPIEVLKTIQNLEETMQYYKNKQRKSKERELRGLYEEHKFAKTEIPLLEKYGYAQLELQRLREKTVNTESYLGYQVDKIREILEENNFAQSQGRGDIARNIKETHCLMMTDVFEKFEGCSAQDLVGFFSCFTNLTLSNDDVSMASPTKSQKASMLSKLAQERLDYYYQQETNKQIWSGENYEMHTDIIDEAMEWCLCTSEEECESFLVKLQQSKGIFIGEFVKAILKINAIAKELEKLSESLSLPHIQTLLAEVGELTLKSVCTSQSLYV